VNPTADITVAETALTATGIEAPIRV